MIIDNKFLSSLICDAPESWQVGLQEPASITMEGILISLRALEFLLLGINLNFVVFSVYLDNIVGQIFVLFILIISATKSTIRLALLMVYFKLKKAYI